MPRLGTAPTTATPGDLVLAGGTLNLSAGFALNANRGIALGPTSGCGTFAVNVASGTLTYGGIIITNNGGSGALAVAGNVSLSGDNAYSGGTTLSSGEILVGNANALGSGTFTVTTGAAATFLDTTALPTGTNTIANNIVLPNDAANTNRTILQKPASPNVLILSGVISGGGTHTTLFSNPNAGYDARRRPASHRHQHVRRQPLAIRSTSIAASFRSTLMPRSGIRATRSISIRTAPIASSSRIRSPMRMRRFSPSPVPTTRRGTTSRPPA